MRDSCTGDKSQYSNVLSAMFYAAFGLFQREITKNICFIGYHYYLSQTLWRQIAEIHLEQLRQNEFGIKLVISLRAGEYLDLRDSSATKTCFLFLLFYTVMSFFRPAFFICHQFPGLPDLLLEIVYISLVGYWQKSRNKKYSQVWIICPFQTYSQGMR